MNTGSDTPAVVILVNGASSSGKSTLCRALQERLTDLADADAAATFPSVAFDDKFRLIYDKLYAIDFVKRSGGDLGHLASRRPKDGRAAWEYSDDENADGRHGGSPLGLARRSDEVCHSHGLEYDVTVRTDEQTVSENVDSIIAALRAKGCLPGERTGAG
jgi:hypothetical protein